MINGLYPKKFEMLSYLYDDDNQTKLRENNKTLSLGTGRLE